MNIDMNTIITGVTIAKACSVKPDKDSTESKTVTVNVKFDGATVKSVFDKSVSGAVIAWQNGVGRKTFDTLKSGQVVNIQFTAPASRGAIDPITAILAAAEAEGISVDEYMKREVARRKAAEGK